MQLSIDLLVYYKDQWWYCRCDDLGLLSHGNTEDEAIENFKEVLDLFLEHTPEAEISSLVRALLTSQKPKVKVQEQLAAPKATCRRLTSAIWETNQYAEAMQGAL